MDRSRDAERPPSSMGSAFLPGALLADRYRIVARIGEGGMGEVYLAHDLVLEQEVALKFLAERIAADPRAVERFRHEARLARQVTHPNVARVHDIGEVDGRHFLTMEYVDGGDLAQLLKRIGRFPREKAAAIAQQICAGLAAAHERGVLHRDLKPANVMLDGEGRVKLTDFGLAEVAGDSTGGAVAGTPAYMSPEQISADKCTERSDVYSLGLVLYELFTGRRAFDAKSVGEYRQMHLMNTPSSPSDLVAEIDPAVERVIMRCLEKEPDQRPPSARAVALALPGGDPLAAAVAAGETPDPELVAAAGAKGGLSVRSGLLCAVAILVVVALVASFSSRLQLAQRVGLPFPTAILAKEARDALASLGHDDPPADSVAMYAGDTSFVAWLVERGGPDRFAPAWEPGSPAVCFLYREGPEPFVPRNTGNVFPEWEIDPAHDRPGMARVRMRPDGRVLSLSIVPPGRAPAAAAGDSADPHPARVRDWTPMFAASGLDPAAFAVAEPRRAPPVATDDRVAWSGSDAVDGWPLRIEAATFAGRPVWWQVVRPWEDVAEPAAGDPRIPTSAVVILVVLLLATLIGGATLARRNVRLRRGDRRGAFRLAMVTLTTSIAFWVVGEHHVAVFDELRLFLNALAMALLWTMLNWVAYLALEPTFRRLWPQRLVSWVRLFEGRWRDPLVGRDLVLAILFGFLLMLLEQVALLLPGWTGQPAPGPTPSSVKFETFALLGGRQNLALIFGVVPYGLNLGLVYVVLFIVLRLALRRNTLAIGAFYVAAVFLEVGPAPELPTLAIAAVAVALWIVALLRLGLLVVVAGMVFYVTAATFPLTLDFSHWYATNSILPLVVIAALAAWGLRAALAGQSLFEDDAAPGARRTG